MSRLRDYLKDHPILSILAGLGSIASVIALFLYDDSKPPKTDVVERAPKIKIVRINTTTSKPHDYPKVEPTSQDATDVSGHVTDINGNPLENVRLTITGSKQEVNSNVSGFFEFQFPRKPSKGEYTITFQKEGYVYDEETYFEVPKLDIRKQLDSFK